MIPKEKLKFGRVGKITDFIEPVPAIPKTIEAWDAFLDGKSAADFTHDPLTLRWLASSASE